jgi:hypothetical protein
VVVVENDPGIGEIKCRPIFVVSDQIREKSDNPMVPTHSARSLIGRLDDLTT